MSNASEQKPLATRDEGAATSARDAAALQTSLRKFHSVERSSQSFCAEAVNLLVKAACAEAAALLVCDPRASRVKLMATAGGEPEIFKALLGQTGLWIPLRALRRPCPSLWLVQDLGLHIQLSGSLSGKMNNLPTLCELAP